jgi:hypothetical protein
MLYKTAVYESNLWIFECLRIMPYYDNAHVGTNLRWKYIGNIEIQHGVTQAPSNRSIHVMLLLFPLANQRPIEYIDDKICGLESEGN